MGVCGFAVGRRHIAQRRVSPNAVVERFDRLKYRRLRRLAGGVFLIYNPTPVGRSPLSLARSTDDGTTWAKVHDLEADAGIALDPAKP